jgi:hypothetical protein
MSTQLHAILNLHDDAVSACLDYYLHSRYLWQHPLSQAMWYVHRCELVSVSNDLQRSYDFVLALRGLL